MIEYSKDDMNKLRAGIESLVKNNPYTTRTGYDEYAIGYARAMGDVMALMIDITIAKIGVESRAISADVNSIIFQMNNNVARIATK